MSKRHKVCLTLGLAGVFLLIFFTKVLPFLIGPVAKAVPPTVTWQPAPVRISPPAPRKKPTVVDGITYKELDRFSWARLKYEYHMIGGQHHNTIFHHTPVIPRPMYQKEVEDTLLKDFGQGYHFLRLELKSVGVVRAIYVAPLRLPPLFHDEYDLTGLPLNEPDWTRLHTPISDLDISQ